MNLDKYYKTLKLAEDLIDDTQDTTFMDFTVILRTLLADENNAAAAYIEKAKKLDELGHSDAAKVLLDIADEELVHAGELQALLDREDLSGINQAIEGANEVNDMLNGEEE